MKRFTLLLVLLAGHAWADSLPTPTLACNAGNVDDTTCDRITEGTTINRPTHVVAGDLLVAFCYDGTALAGFTDLGAGSMTVGASSYYSGYRIASDSEATTYALTGTGGCYIAAFSSIDQSSPYDGNAAVTSGSGTSATLSNITTSADNALLWYGCSVDSASSAPPAGWTEEWDTGGGWWETSGRTMQPSAGAIGTHSLTVGSGSWACVVASFKYNATGTRLYLDSATAPSVSPAYDAGWEDTDQAQRRVAKFSKGSSAMATQTINEETGDTTSGADFLGTQFSIEVGAQTISGLVQCNVRVAEANAADNARSQSKIWLADSSGASTSEVLLDFTGNTTSGNPTDEWGTSLAARNINRKSTDSNAHTLTSQTAANGDYLVIELGFRVHQTNNTARAHTMRWGDTAATPLDRDDAETADNYPWCDFLGGVTAASAGTTCNNQIAILGAGCK